MKTVLEITPDISYKSPGKFEETRFEKIHNEIFKNSAEASVTRCKSTSIKFLKPVTCKRVSMV